MPLPISASPSTWRTLGIFTGITYLALGTTGFVAPTWVCQTFGITTAPPSSSDAPSPPAASEGALAMAPLMCARDLTIGAALVGMSCLPRPEKPMGVLILSGMILCAADIWQIYVAVGGTMAGSFALGAGVWGVVGWGLLFDAGT